MTLLILFIMLATIGAFDVGYYHMFKLRLFERPECNGEQVAHTCRGVLFCGMLALVAFGEPRGVFAVALLVLFAVDTVNTIVDTFVEQDSRSALGGLERGEYMTHVLGSVCIGAAAMYAFITLWPHVGAPSGFAVYSGSSAALASLVQALLVMTVAVVALELGLHLKARLSHAQRALSRPPDQSSGASDVHREHGACGIHRRIR